MTHAFQEPDPVVLVRELPARALRAGDLGAIVLVHTPEVFEVEFAKVSGRAQQVVTIDARDLRAVEDDDVITVRGATPTDLHRRARAGPSSLATVSRNDHC